MSGWSLVHCSCRRLLRSSVAQSTANTNCHAIGGHLALVSSAEEKAAVQAFIQSEGIGPTGGTWIDGSDATHEGVWLTSAGDVMSYVGFTRPEPNGGTFENCMRLKGAIVQDEGCNRADRVVAALCEL